MFVTRYTYAGRFFSSLSFVPKHRKLEDSDVNTFCDFINEHGPPLVLTGAGISTESGIPDYRSEGVGLFSRTHFKPTNHIEFLKNPVVRRRYWARNYIGWPRFSSSKPNPTHKCLAELERNRLVSSVITQNVDHLHSKAGSRDVVELHGTGYRVVCLTCDHSMSRHGFQRELDRHNGDFEFSRAQVNPDGDVTLPPDVADRFVIPPCLECGGILKPYIVFFGDNVPQERQRTVQRLVGKCNSLVTLGTSMMVYSSYRIALQAFELRKPILAVNIGPTRADSMINVKLDVRCGQLLQLASEKLLHANLIS